MESSRSAEKILGSGKVLLQKKCINSFHSSSTFIGADLSIVEELFSLLIKCEKKNCAAIPFQGVDPRGI